MPRKATTNTEEAEIDLDGLVSDNGNDENKIENLNRMLAAVLNYLSDDEVEEIDIEYLLANTEGLRDWWDHYRESNRKQIEEEIKNSLAELSLEELESIREKIKEKV
ncbi:hypothetical protein DS745_13080 [Anaerobacillus alkaliphilus]|uniref:Uncharacterized protein n=1 Tax=Anaerobacillus alkaliphilus TaxID=1548597 RepID=A0A4V1LG97_9BACI|nr:hypothetical protein [Anaerobacillus alkaliphilus]RXI99811.1 hypothetical protein DS745_13080 [Anaerobacillus alkaliphilus]